MGKLGSALRRGMRKHQFSLLSLEKTAQATVRVVCSLAGGGNNAPLSFQIRILLPHLLFANLEYSCTRGSCSLVPETVRALLHQPDLCFYPLQSRLSCWLTFRLFVSYDAVGQYGVEAVSEMVPPADFTKSGAAYQN